MNDCHSLLGRIQIGVYSWLLLKGDSKDVLYLKAWSRNLAIALPVAANSDMALLIGRRGQRNLENSPNFYTVGYEKSLEAIEQNIRENK